MIEFVSDVDPFILDPVGGVFIIETGTIQNVASVTWTLVTAARSSIRPGLSRMFPRFPSLAGLRCSASVSSVFLWSESGPWQCTAWVSGRCEA